MGGGVGGGVGGGGGGGVGISSGYSRVGSPIDEVGENNPPTPGELTGSGWCTASDGNCPMADAASGCVIDSEPNLEKRE